MQDSEKFHPTLHECYTAREVFTQAFQHYSAINGREVAIRYALDAVWS